MTQTYKVQVSMNQAHIVESGFVWKQGDFGFNIEIEVLDFDTTGATPQIIFRKSTGAVEATEISVANNKFTYAIRGTELDTPGPCVCDLKLNDSTTKRVSTASFKYFVIPDTMDGLEQEASSYSDTIEQIVGGFDADIENINNNIGKNIINENERIKTILNFDFQYTDPSNSLDGKYWAKNGNQIVLGDDPSFKAVAAYGVPAGTFYVMAYSKSFSFVQNLLNGDIKNFNELGVSGSGPVNIDYPHNIYISASSYTQNMVWKTSADEVITYGAYNVTYNTDKTLLIEDQIADAKTTGDYLRLTSQKTEENRKQLKHNNSIDTINRLIDDDTSRSHRGVTFTYNDYTITMNGTSTGNANFYYFDSVSSFPEGIIPGGKFFAYYEKDISAGVSFQIFTYDINGTASLLYETEGASGDEIQIPVDAHGIQIRIITPKNIAFNNNKLSAKLTNEPDNKKLYELITPLLTKKEITVGSSGCDFTSFTDAIKYAYAQGNITLRLKNEVFDITTETDISTEGAGLPIGKGVHILGETGTIIRCNYTGGVGAVQRAFSILNADASDFIVENVRLEGENIRYCVHDDVSGTETPYTHKYINCSMYHDSHEALWRSPQCIGGGCGTNGTIIVDGGLYECVPEYESTTNDIGGPYSEDLKNYPISWHRNSANYDAGNHIIIKNTYLIGATSKVVLSSGTNGTIEIYNNSFGTYWSWYGSTGTPYIWNNEIRGT